MRSAERASSFRSSRCKLPGRAASRAASFSRNSARLSPNQWAPRSPPGGRLAPILETSAACSAIVTGERYTRDAAVCKMRTRMYKKVLAMWVAAGAVVWGQAQSDPAPKVDRAAAYYYYSVAHLYADLASNSTNGRVVADYINEAIDHYKLAIKADPRSPIIPEELSEVYIGSGRFREAQSEAEETLRSNL